MKVVSLSTLWRAELEQRLRAGVRLIALEPDDFARIAAEAADTEVLLTTRFDARLAAVCKSLELILCPAAGTEGIDRTVVPPGVRVINGVGHEIPIAEYAIGALVALRQRFRTADAQLRADKWRFGFAGTGDFVDELFGSSLGILGFGRIGVEIAKRAAAFGMSTGALTLHPSKALNATPLPRGLGDLGDPAQVDQLVQSSDAVVVACELSPLTVRLLDARRFGLMRRGAIVVNVARGPIVDERAVFDALAENRIAGAALDVWYRYPDDKNVAVPPSVLPFATLDNVLMTPHSSGWTEGAKQRKLEFLAACINERYESRRSAR